MEETSKNKINSVFLIPIIALVSIWIIYIVEIQFSLNFNRLGVYPRTLKGLIGVVFSPFIHSTTKHLLNNSLPLFLLLSGLFYFYNKIALKVLVVGAIVTGLLTWLIGRDSYHIGASGVIYFLFSFVFFSGLIRKHYRLVALSLAVVFWYGGMVWYIFPMEERVSWEGHLSGFLVGIVLAIVYRKVGPQAEKFEYSENKEFEMLFDEDGNFMEQPTIEENEDEK